MARLDNVPPRGTAPRILRGRWRIAAWQLAMVVLLAELVARPPASRAADGDLDLMFGDGGKVTTDLGALVCIPPCGSFGNALVLQPDGKLVVAGVAASAFVLARYNGNGTLNASFGREGEVATFFGPLLQVSATAHALVLQPDGKVVAVGQRVDASDLQHFEGDFALARYNLDGSLDSTFGSEGRVTTDFFAGGFAGGDEAFAAVLQSDGKLVAAGCARSLSFGEGGALARYNVDGSLDASFGTGGTVASASDCASAVVLKPDGKLVVAQRGFGLVEFGADGTPGFGTAGAGGDDAFALVRQFDGKLVVAGVTSSSGDPSNTDFVLARYAEDFVGEQFVLDHTFGLGGRVVTDFFGGPDGIFAVAQQRDGKLVAVGFATEGEDANPPACGDIILPRPCTNFALARYNEDGSLDPTFGVGGKVVTDFLGSDDEAHAVVLQSDGNIVAAGTATKNGRAQFALARYEARIVTTTTTTPTTTTTTATTTTVPCTSARCTIESGLTSAPCAGQAIPARVTQKLDRAVGLIEQVATSPTNQARKLLHKARKNLKGAKASATRAAKGKKPKLSSDCAAAIGGAADAVLAGLRV